jgi:hypothetical protein
MDRGLGFFTEGFFFCLAALDLVLILGFLATSESMKSPGSDDTDEDRDLDRLLLLELLRALNRGEECALPGYNREDTPTTSFRRPLEVDRCCKAGELARLPEREALREELRLLTRLLLRLFTRLLLRLPLRLVLRLTARA